jgi:sterol 24-C-methyltransferase
MKLSEQFGEGSFDAVYAIEATVHAPSFEGIYGEIFKVLKSGGTAGIYEWVMTDAWNPKNPEHKRIAHGIEAGDGIAEMRNAKNAYDALVATGFESAPRSPSNSFVSSLTECADDDRRSLVTVIKAEDLADRPDPIPWYYPLEGDLRKCQTLYDCFTVFRTSKLGQIVTQNGVWALEKVGLVPQGTFEVGESLGLAAAALVEGGQRKVSPPPPLSLSICQARHLTLPHLPLSAFHADDDLHCPQAALIALRLWSPSTLPLCVCLTDSL